MRCIIIIEWILVHFIVTKHLSLIANVCTQIILCTTSMLSALGCFEHTVVNQIRKLDLKLLEWNSKRIDVTTFANITFQ